MKDPKHPIIPEKLIRNPEPVQTTSAWDADNEEQARSIPPGPCGENPDANVSGAGPGPLQFLLNLTRQYGDVVHYQTTYGPLYFFNHPDHVKEVLHSTNCMRASLVKLVLGEGLLASDGNYWRSQRRLMQPSFLEHRIVEFGPLITGATIAALRRWEPYAENGQPLDMALEMRRLTLDIVFKALFSADLSSEIDPLCEVVTILMEDMGDISCTLLNSPLRLSPSRNNQFQAALQTVNRIVYGMISERRQCREKPNDLLSLLMSVRDETGQGLDDNQVRDEVVTMLIAGHETTALSLSWAWYLLAKHPAAEQRLHDELTGALAGRTPTMKDLPELPYTRQVLQESLRLYPPVWFMVRKASADDEIAGYKIPSNAFVVVSPYTTHRHPEYWENPEQFDPERFTPELSARRHRHAYLPFAGGRHICLGIHFAMMEGQLITATIAQQYRLKLLPGHPVEAQPALTLRQRHGLMVTLERAL
jgi:cytochrome P450